MRHRVANRKLGRITPHRIAMLRNLATALFERERIQTTLVKAKELRPYAERMITLAKREDSGNGARLHARRQVARDIHDGEVVKKLFDTLSPRYASRPGGYTRILRLGPRKGDGAEMAIVELIGSEYQPDKAKKPAKGEKPAADAKPKAEKAARPRREKAPKTERAGKGAQRGARKTAATRKVGGE
jgi:large subunit ribosomal protein L17